MVTDSPPLHIVHLIHGTWARRASWTQDSSKLVHACRKDLPGPVLLDCLDWNGHNSPSSRAKAKIELRRKIASYSTRYPSAQQSVIAHSHGGHIAVSAVSESPFSSSMPVVCMQPHF